MLCDQELENIITSLCVSVCLRVNLAKAHLTNETCLPLFDEAFLFIRTKLICVCARLCVVTAVHCVCCVTYFTLLSARVFIEIALHFSVVPTVVVGSQVF